jgi:uncharacterized repeat protein (TIGR03803 family)
MIVIYSSSQLSILNYIFMKRILLVVISFIISLTSHAQNLLWGTSINGGGSGTGVLFQYDPSSSSILKKLDFDSTATGKNPTGSLVKGLDGKLYGLTINGGATNQGVLFQFDPVTSTFIKKVDFSGVTGGSKPTGVLLQAGDGKLYGMTTIGGANNKGVLFQYDPATSTFTKKIDFDGTTNGANPKGALMMTADGKLYGMTSNGGVNNKGCIFQYDVASSTLTKKFDLNGFTNGAEPHGSLVQANDGNLYGMTRLGGVFGKGVFFQYNPATSTYLKKFDFNGADKGAEPYGSMLLAADGKLYGMTEDGGTNNVGVIFQYDPATSIYTKKLNFGGTDGSKPSGSFVIAADGKLYGTTAEGGVNSMGVIFQYDIASATYTKKSDFNGSANGQHPVDLTEAPVNCIVTLTVNTQNCAGNTINIPFTVTGIFGGGNVFTAQLSDASGSFSSPETIGTLASNTSGSINATLSSTTAPGIAYRIRVISSDPATIGNNNGSNISINSTPIQPGAFTASSTSVNRGQNGVVFSVPSDPSVTYTWSYSGAGATINGSGNSITMDFSLIATSGNLSVTGLSNGCTSPARTIAISIGTTGPTSSQSPYLLPTIPNAQFTSILTTTDAVGAYKMDGTPDGLGAFDNGNGTFTLLMNHEFVPTAGIVRVHGSKGAFVSKWIINKSNLAVVSGSDLIQTVKLWNGSGYSAYNASAPSALTAFNRFCSGDLPAPAAFYNSITGLGTQEKIYMNGEESGNEGRAFAHIVTGTEAGTSYELPYLGKLSWENAVACPFTGDKTVVAGMDDSTPGQVYFYVGTKTNTGNDIDKAGLTNGKLFGIALAGLSTETSGSVPAPNSPFTLADLGQVQNLTGTTINTNSNNIGITTFLRPEDGAWDPAHPGDFYFNTTNAFNSPSRLWKVHFTNIANPELGGTITAVLNGTEGQQMLDNMTIDNSGHILLVEDVGNNAHLGKVWQYTMATDELKQVGEHDPSRFLNGASNFLTQDEEASGIIDVQNILGPGMFLTVDQAHYSIPGEFVEGGQLLAYYNPDSYTAAPLAYTINGGGSYCQGDTTGLPVGLSNSQTTVNYQLIKNDTVPVGPPVAGTGSSISFGNQTDAGAYKVIATSTVNNSSTPMTGSVTIIVSPLPTASITAGGDTTFCAGDSVLLTATGGDVDATYLWSNGKTTQTTAALTTGNYTVTITNAYGCSSTPSAPTIITTHTIAGDFNNDGKVGTTDLNMLLEQFGMNCTCLMDLNHDSKVTVTDLNIFLPQFGKTCNGIQP